MHSKITAYACVFPENEFYNQEIEEKISKNFAKIPFGILEETTWVQSRFFVSEWEFCSDLAIRASQKCFEKFYISKDEIDLLIFASASQDIIEPATANIIQEKLWLSCPVFDVKNACNSFLSGIDIADGFIRAGKYKKILICSGETPSKAIKFDVKDKENFKKHFASYTFWDAGAAMILEKTDEKSGIISSFFKSDGSSWDLGTIMGWWCRFPQDVEKNYFVWEPAKLRDKFKNIWSEIFNEEIAKIGWKKEEITQIFIHQVAMSNFDFISEELSIPKEKFTIILPKYGNIASCCIPTAFSEYSEKNPHKKWDKFVFMGFASGFSYGLIFYEV